MVLDKLEEDPMQLVREIDWVTKRHLIQSYVDKKGCGWDDPRVFLLDLQFHDVKRTSGLYYLMESRGLIERVVEEDAVQRAMSTPPQTTRAKVRGDFIRFARAKNRSYTVDWTYLKLNGYWEETILCMDPFSAVNRRVDELVSQVSGLRFYRCMTICQRCKTGRTVRIVTAGPNADYAARVADQHLSRRVVFQYASCAEGQRWAIQRQAGTGTWWSR